MRCRAICGGLFAVFAVVGLVPATVAANDVQRVFDQASPSVVVIRGRGRDVGVNGRGLTYITEVGSGVVISADGDIITAAHVVQAMDELTVEFPGGPVASAHVVASEPAADLALLRAHTLPVALNVATLGDSDASALVIRSSSSARRTGSAVH